MLPACPALIHSAGTWQKNEHRRTGNEGRPTEAPKQPRRWKSGVPRAWANANVTHSGNGTLSLCMYMRARMLLHANHLPLCSSNFASTPMMLTLSPSFSS